jgi:hypothetical protein
MMAWYSEKTHLPNIARGVNTGCWDEFRDAWYTDLEKLTTADTKDEALQTANAYLKYYGARTKITDVGWDLENRCFTWEVLDFGGPVDSARDFS